MHAVPACWVLEYTMLAYLHIHLTPLLCISPHTPCLHVCQASLTLRCVAVSQGMGLEDLLDALSDVYRSQANHVLARQVLACSYDLLMSCAYISCLYVLLIADTSLARA